MPDERGIELEYFLRIIYVWDFSTLFVELINENYLYYFL